MSGAAAAAATQAILSSAAVIAIGALSNAAGMLSPTSIGELSMLQSMLLEPCLAFASLSSLRAADLLNGMPLLCWAPVHMLLALAVAMILLPRNARRGPLLVCAAFGNAGAMPVALIPTLLPSAMVPQGLLFIQVYLVTWRILLWSIGPALLRPSALKKTDATHTSVATTSPSWRSLLFPPPTAGSVAGLAVAFAPAAVGELFATSGPLSFVVSAARQAGAASPPIALITLGSALLVGGGASAASNTARGARSPSRSTRSTRSRSPAPPRAANGTAPLGSFTLYEMLAVCATRLLVLPCLHLALCGGQLAHWSGIAPARASLDEPLYLVLLLQAAMPSAVSVQAIFQRAAVDTRPLGRLMILQYALAMPAVVGVICLSAALV